MLSSRRPLTLTQGAFTNEKTAAKMIKLKAFAQFKDTVEAVAAATAMVEGSLSKSLKKFLQKQVGC